MKKILKYSGIILLFFFVAEAHALVINEVLYDPAGSDNNKEFIEIVTNEPLNLTGWIIADAEANDTLTELRYHEQTETFYLLIVEEGFNYTELNASIYSAGATIGNNLNNDYDEIKLFAPNGTLGANMSYNQTLDGTSFEYANDTYRQSFFFGGTPGRENSREENSGVNETANETAVEEDSLFILPVLNETADETGNETTNELPAPEHEEQESCVMPFTINTSTSLIQNKDPLTYSFTPAENATFEYWIEDLAGAVMRKKRTTTSTAPKSFTPSITEKEKAFVIQANAYTNGCSFHAEKLIVVENPNAPEPKETKQKTTEKRKEPQKQHAPRRIHYSTTGIPDTILLENNTAALAFFLDIANDDEDHRFEVWSYVFRGPKSYSSGREENKQDLVLGAGQEVRITLVNTVNLTPGTYSLKIKIRKDNQASTTDLVRDLVFEESPESAREEKIPDKVKTLISPQSATIPAARVVQRRNPLPAILGALGVGVIIMFIWVKV